MLHNAEYDKIKLLHQLSRMAWFIEKHAKVDAQDQQYTHTLNNLLIDVEKHISILKNQVCK